MYLLIDLLIDLFIHLFIHLFIIYVLQGLKWGSTAL